MSVLGRLNVAALLIAVLVVGCPSEEEAGVAPEDPDAGADATPPAPCGRLTTLCEEGRQCEGAPDCSSALCRDGVCKVVDPADGAKNGDETDVDCGGTRSPACADLKGCISSIDCKSGVCKLGVCQVPTFTDAVKNGD